MNKTLFAMMVTFHLKPGCEEEFLAFVHPIVDAMRYEPTFINATMHRSTEDPLCFMIHETWLDQENFFNVQMKRPYRAAYEARLPELVSQQRNIEIFELLRSDFVFHNRAEPKSIP